MTTQPTTTGDVVLVHTSDLHVEDSAVGRYHGLLGLRAVLQKAQSLSADIVLLAGDTFDNHRVSDVMLRRTRDMLADACVRAYCYRATTIPSCPTACSAARGWTTWSMSTCWA